MEEDDTVSGGESLSVEQAASAFIKSTAPEPDEGQTGQDGEDQGEQADDELQASDEGEGEDDGEPDKEGQAEEEDGDEPETDQGRFVASNGKVKLPDGTVLTVADLVQGNLRDRDYRQKTMGLAEERRAFEAQSSALQASTQQVSGQRDYMVQLLQSLSPQPPDQSLLVEGSPTYDPFGYIAQKEHYEAWTGHLNTLLQQSDAARKQAEDQQTRQRQERAGTEWQRLQEAIPELRDKAKADAVFSELQSAGESAGFSRQELIDALPYDHRFSIVLRKAAQWDKLQASKPKVVQQMQGRPPVQKSGKRLTPDAQRARRSQDAMSRLKETGSLEDAASAYLATRRG